MSEPVKIKSVEMTREIMCELEREGLILRLAPGCHYQQTPPGESVGRVLYESKEEYGPHRLLAVTSGRCVFSRLGSHPDNEEVWLIGDPSTRPFYLLIARMKHDALLEKKNTVGLSAGDFICLKARFNDPQVSFFALLADVPHDEATCSSEPGVNPSFYVTESSRMGVRMIEMERPLMPE